VYERLVEIVWFILLLLTNRQPEAVCVCVCLSKLRSNVECGSKEFLESFLFLGSLILQ